MTRKKDAKQHRENSTDSDEGIQGNKTRLWIERDSKGAGLMRVDESRSELRRIKESCWRFLVEHDMLILVLILVLTLMLMLLLKPLSPLLC